MARQRFSSTFASQGVPFGESPEDYTKMGRGLVKRNPMMSWLPALVLLTVAVPATAEAQSRDRDRDGRRVWSGMSRGLIPNFFVKRASRTRLGLYLNARQSRRYDDQGALIDDVMHRSPAEEAGLRDGDIITAFDGHELTSPLFDSELEDALDSDESLPAQRVLALAREVEAGQVVEIRYLRDGSAGVVSVEAEEYDLPRISSFGSSGDVMWSVGPDAHEWDDDMWEDRREEMGERMRGLGERLERMNIPQVFDFTYGAESNEGVELVELNPELGTYFGVERGVLVMEVDEDSTLGLVPGDVILEVGDREVETVRRARRLIRSYEAGEPIRMTVVRRGDELVTEGFMP